MGRHALFLIAAVLLVASAIVGSAAAVGHRPATVCGPARGQTLVGGSKARIYSLAGSKPPNTERVLGCLRSSSPIRRPSPLGFYGSQDNRLLERVQLRVPWVAGLYEDTGHGIPELVLRAENLRTGAVNGCEVGAAEGPDEAYVGGFVLSRSGGLAWIGFGSVKEEVLFSPSESARQVPSRVAPPVPPVLTFKLIEAYEKELLACPGGLLAAGNNLDVESLELHGSTLTWIDGGETGSATLG